METMGLLLLGIPAMLVALKLGILAVAVTLAARGIFQPYGQPSALRIPVNGPARARRAARRAGNAR